MNRLLSPLALLLSMCGGQPGVLLDIGSWPEGAATLRVDGTLNGIPMANPLSFPGSPTQFVVYVADGDSGQLSLVLSALDGNDCPRATGQTQVQVGGDLRRIAEAQVVMATVAGPPYCLAPQLDAITPGLGPSTGGTTLTLTGHGFMQSSNVTVDGSAAGDFTLISSTQTKVTLPANLGAFGKVPVLLKNPDGQSASRSDLFGYYPGQLSFDQPVDFGPGALVESVAVGDFNRDGKPDLVFVNANGSNLSVLLGDGMGGFGAATNFAAGMLPLGVAVGDFNKDQKLDLAVANAQSNNVSVLLGDGVGGFGTATNFAVGSGPQMVVIGDFNGDNKPDLASANLSGNSVSVLLGDGMGGFGTATDFTVDRAPRSLATGDFNGDQKLDLVAANDSSADVSVLLGNGKGRFGTAANFVVGMTPWSVAVADLDGDQRLDCVVSNRQSNSVSVLLGNGLGGFGAPTDFATGSSPEGLALADVNGDQILDLAVTNFGDSKVSVLLGNGKGGFGSATNLTVGPGPVWVATGDFNLDQKLDLVTANESESKISRSSRPSICPRCVTPSFDLGPRNQRLRKFSNICMSSSWRCRTPQSSGEGILGAASWPAGCAPAQSVRPGCGTGTRKNSSYSSRPPKMFCWIPARPLIWRSSASTSGNPFLRRSMRPSPR